MAALAHNSGLARRPMRRMTSPNCQLSDYSLPRTKIPFFLPVISNPLVVTRVPSANACRPLTHLAYRSRGLTFSWSFEIRSNSESKSVDASCFSLRNRNATPRQNSPARPGLSSQLPNIAPMMGAVISSGDFPFPRIPLAIRKNGCNRDSFTTWKMSSPDGTSSFSTFFRYQATPTAADLIMFGLHSFRSS